MSFIERNGDASSMGNHPKGERGTEYVEIPQAIASLKRSRGVVRHDGLLDNDLTMVRDASHHGTRCKACAMMCNDMHCPKHAPMQSR